MRGSVFQEGFALDPITGQHTAMLALARVPRCARHGLRPLTPLPDAARGGDAMGMIGSEG